MSYDIVIVGGGSTGCVLAARLTENTDRNVLLIEAGPGFQDAASCPVVLRDERSYIPDYLWTYPGFRNAREVEPSLTIWRGRALGGSGSVNGMIWQRPLPEDIAGWGWLPERVEEALACVECKKGDEHSAGAVPVTITPQDQWTPLHRAFFNALRDMGYPENPDMSRPANLGVGGLYRNSFEGVRYSAAFAYLLPVLARPNLTVRCDTTVSRILLDGDRATGVEYEADGALHEISAGEVVVSAGAIESPHLLMRSGIGPRAQLESAGVPVRVDLGAVGQHLTDHGLVMNLLQLDAERESADPRFCTGLVYTSADGDPSDMQLLALTGEFTGGHNVDGALIPMLFKPDGVGSVSLDPTGVNVPRIVMNYLECERDRARFREAERIICELVDHEGLRELLVGAQDLPDGATLESDEQLDAWVGAHLATAFHGCGTCRMGDGDDTVVDLQGHVHGVDALRVVDISIIPEVPRSGTNELAMAIGERISADWDRAKVTSTPVGIA